jgi:hypothetical protein
MSKLRQVCTPLGRNSSTYRIGGYVGYRTGQDIFKKKRMFCPCRDSNQIYFGCPAVNLVTEVLKIVTKLLKNKAIITFLITYILT